MQENTIKSVQAPASGAVAGNNENDIDQAQFEADKRAVYK